MESNKITRLYFSVYTWAYYTCQKRNKLCKTTILWHETAVKCDQFHTGAAGMVNPTFSL